MVMSALELASPTGYNNYVSLQIGDNSASKIGLLKFASSYNSGNGAELYQGTNGDFIIQANGSARIMTMTASGLVGINENSPSAQLQVKSGATNRVPLIVDTLASHATNLQEWKINGTVQAFVDNGGYFRGTGIYNKSTFNNSIIYLNNTGTLIQRNIADTNPALIVNLANASATGNIQVWQKAGVAVANITESGQLATPVVKNVLNGSNSLLELSNNGAIISRNRTDSNPALRVNQIHASSTGDLLQLEKEGVDVYAFTHDGTLKAPATFTIDPSTHGNATGKVIILGDLQVDGTTTTINSTTLEVDDKNIELSKGAANKAASDGAGISIDLGTDGEANLTYGATDDIFNLNKGLNIAGQTQISSATFPALSVERTTTATGSVIGVSRFLATTSGDMGDGFGGSISFQIKDNANVDNTLATIVGIRSGADNSGRLSLQTNNAGTQTEKMTILPNGKVGIGTASPSTVLNLVTQSNTDGIQIRRNSNTSGEYGLLSFRIATSESAVNYAEIRAIRTDRAVAQDTDLVLLTRSNSAVTERLRIRDDGLVGIGETSPTAQLVVKSGATNRIPLIVDSLTGQTADLQRWLINGSNISKLDSLGAWYGYGVYNLANGNNGFLRLADTGATISRNIADTNPALIVNLANASATGNIQVWQKAGVAKAVIDNGGYFSGTGVYNLSSSANAVIFLNNTGTEINRNVNDANVVLKVKQQNVSATGDLQQWIYGTNTYAYVDKDGDFYNSSGSYGQISDLRVKENIVEARDYTEDLMKLRVVKYSLKKDQEQEATKLGFIAQEVEEVFPNMVQTTKTEELEDMKSIKMSVLIPMLVKTIQEQEKRIKELEAKIK
jgi:hypothetical protein